MKNRISLHTHTQASVSSDKRDRGTETVHLVLESFSQLSCCGVNLKIRREDADLFLEGLTPQTTIVGEQTSGPFLCMKATPGCDAARRSLLGPNRRIMMVAAFQWPGTPLQGPVYQAGSLRSWLQNPLGNLPEGHFHLHSNFQPSSDPYREVSTLAGLWLAPSAAAIPMHPGKKTQSSAAACLSCLRSGKPEESAKHCLKVLTLLLKKLTVFVTSSQHVNFPWDLASWNILRVHILASLLPRAGMGEPSALRQRTQADLGTSCRDQHPLMAPPFSSSFLHKSLLDGTSHCVQLSFFCFLWLVMSIQITQMPGYGRWWVSKPEKVPLSLFSSPLEKEDSPMLFRNALYRNAKDKTVLCDDLLHSKMLINLSNYCSAPRNTVSR